MQIRTLQEGTEYICDEKGEFINCPICGECWMQEIEGEVEHGICPHLRFSFHSDGGFEFYNSWSGQKVMQDFEALVDTGVENDSFYGYCDIFQKLKPGGVDEIVYREWSDFPLVHWEMYWGFTRQ